LNETVFIFEPMGAFMPELMLMIVESSVEEVNTVSNEFVDDVNL
jgi:hypothetical protein